MILKGLVSMIKLINDDCMNIMKDYDDNHFDLAICDPPYGVNITKYNKGWTTSKKCLAQSNIYGNNNWDNKKPDSAYFEELFRVSKNQIIWGGNYFTDSLTSKRCWIVWDKENDGTATADFEMAWTSFDSSARIYRHLWRGFLQKGDYEKKIHIAQKPVKLYEWILNNYAEKGQKILDTHLGSGSIAIACHYYGVDLLGIEIDKEYYDKAKERIDQLTRQETLF